MLVSLEMSAPQLGQRALADVADVFLSSIARGRYSSQQADRIVRAQRELADLPMRIRDVAGQRVDEIARQARAIARSQAGLRLLVLDHLHITELPPEAGRLGATWGVGQVSRGLKQIAKDLEIPVVALAQLNRGLESREDKRPTLADLRQSGDIEQDADAVIFLHRGECFLPTSPPERAGRSAERHAEAVAAHQAAADAASGRAELIVAKNRDGALGTVHLRFDGARTRFFDPEDRS